MGVALREETDRAVTKANGSEAARNEANQRADEWEEKQRKWQKKASEKQDLLDLKIEELILAEIKVIGDNMKAMEVSEEKAHQREDILKDQIRHLVSRLKDAESRAEYGEMNVQRIHLQIDQLEDELIGQKQKCKTINDELQQTFNDMVEQY